MRVHVEHALAGVKRSRIVKDVLRNKRDDTSDSAIEAACGLHNLRVRYRKNGVGQRNCSYLNLLYNFGAAMS